MINFFRKIRKQLADDNKPLKYARYAIGEILLVVVGILIALQINTWKEDRKDKELYYSYLIRLKEDFTEMLNSTKEAQIIEKRLVELGEMVLNFDQETAKDINPLQFAIALDYTAGRHFYKKSSQTWADLISTGNLNLLDNKELRNQIGAYNSLIDQRHFQIEEWFAFKVKYRDLTRHILRPEERLYLPEDWPYGNFEDPAFEDFKLQTTLDEMKSKLKAIPELKGVLTDVVLTRNITVTMMTIEVKLLSSILMTINDEISKLGFKNTSV